MQIRANPIARPTHRAPPARSARRGPSDTGGQPAVLPLPVQYSATDWQDRRRAGAQTRPIQPDTLSPYARRALAAYWQTSRPEIPEYLVRLDCYA